MVKVKEKDHIFDHIKRLQIFYQTQFVSSLYSFSLALILYFFYRTENQLTQHLWLTSQFIIMGLRLVLRKIFIKETTSEPSALQGEKVYSLVLGINAMAWGAAIYVFYPLSQGLTILVPMIFPLSVLVGGVTKMAISKIASSAYIIGVITVFSSFFLTSFSELSILMATAGVMFAVFLLQAAIKNYDNHFQIELAFQEEKKHLKQLEDNLKLKDELTLQKEISNQTSKLASLGEMAGGIAHEVNNPLSIIKLNADSLKKKVIKGKDNKENTLQTLDNILNTIERVSKIVKGLLVFSRKSDHLKKETKCLKELVKETLEITHEKFYSNGIEIKKYFQAEEFHVEVNQIALSQVLINLLNNSYYFIKDMENAWIELTLAINEENIIELSVKDSGKNIPEEIQEKLFESFFTTKPSGSGTGLGLSVSKNILKEHKGDLVYVSGDHPCFLITLPKAEDFQNEHLDDKENQDAA